MKNYEKYLDKVLELASDVMGVNKEGKPCSCSKLPCSNCICTSGSGLCNEVALKWLKEEYVEPEVDWSKVEVDTKILVRAFEGESWFPRYFAKYKDGEVYVFIHGATSYSTDEVCTYRYAKLYEGEQE